MMTNFLGTKYDDTESVDLYWYHKYWGLDNISVFGLDGNDLCEVMPRAVKTVTESYTITNGLTGDTLIINDGLQKFDLLVFENFSYDGGNGTDTLVILAGNSMWSRSYYNIDDSNNSLANVEIIKLYLDVVEDEIAPMYLILSSATKILGDLTIYGSGEAHNVIWSNEGNDTIYGFGGNDYILGAGGNDTIFGGLDDDLIGGNKGDDTLHGDEGNDTLNGNSGNDSIYGDDGLDILIGGNGLDYLDGGRGNDKLDGGLDSDVLNGGEGNDTILCGSGNDVANGGAGADYLSGYNGNDILNGGAGIDRLYGGADADTFVFDADALTGRDTVKDFSLAQGDKLELHDLLVGYDPLTSAITDFLRITDNGVNSYVAVDANGATGGTAWTQIARLDGAVGLTDEAGLLTSGVLLVTSGGIV